MFRWIRPHLGDERGDTLLLALIAVGAAGALALFFAQQLTSQSRINQQRIEEGQRSALTSTGAEMMILAYRQAEIRYFRAISESGCTTPKSFVLALREGSNCDLSNTATGVATDGGNLYVPVFAGTDPGTDDNLYSYGPSGCFIYKDKAVWGGTTTPCFSPAPSPIVTMGREGSEEQRVNQVGYEFNIQNIIADGSQRLVEVQMRIFRPARTLASGSLTEQSTLRTIGIRGDLRNVAYPNSNGEVLQTSPDPLARCPGAAGGLLPVFDPVTKECRTFSCFTPGGGLAYTNFYQGGTGRFFSFNQNSGDVFDLLTCKRIDEATGKLTEVPSGETPEQIFPAYGRDVLVHANDITTIGNEIYYLTTNGGSAQIQAVLPPSTPGDVPDQHKQICDLGSIASLDGIVALDRSDVLLKGTGDRVAEFMMYSGGVDPRRYFVTVLAEGNFPNGGADPKCIVTSDPVAAAEIPLIQTIEGFDRTSAPKPYFQY